MEFYRDNENEELGYLMKTLIAQTKDGKIQWNCTAYNPIGIILERDEKSDSDASLSQMFEMEALLNERKVFIELMESIDLPSMKGDITASISLDVDDGTTKEDIGLSYDDAYDDCDAAGVCGRYQDSMIASLADALIPLFEGAEALREGFSYARFVNEIDFPERILKQPMVRLCEKLMNEGRAMDFHSMILDMKYRDKLLDEVK